MKKIKFSLLIIYVFVIIASCNKEDLFDKTKTFTILPEKLPNDITFSHPQGIYNNDFSLILSSLTAEKIVYTLNGTSPTITKDGIITNGILYSAPIEINNLNPAITIDPILNLNVNILGWKTGYSGSDITSLIYTLKCANLTYSPNSLVALPTNLNINSITVGKSIYYTQENGTNVPPDPTTLDNLYTAPFEIPFQGGPVERITTFKIVVTKAKYVPSDIFYLKYQRNSANDFLILFQQIAP